MFVYQVVQPFSYQISGDSLKSAIKSFVKTHRDLNLASIIINDQNQHVEARFKYFLEDGRNKIGINTFPYLGAITNGPPFYTWYDSLPGASGIPLTPSMPTSTSFLFSPSVPYTPVPILTTESWLPTIIEFNR